MASIVGSQYGFFAPQNGAINVVFSVDGSNLPAAVPSVFNLEYITSPTGVSYTLPTSYQGVAILPGGTGQSLNLLLGNVGVTDNGTSDTITAGPGNNSIVGGQLDTITGGTGNDVIDASAGSESVTGGSAGNDTITSGTGDTINGGGANVTIIGAGGDTITGGTGVDSVDGALTKIPGGEAITGGSGAATISGGTGDTITGG